MRSGTTKKNPWGEGKTLPQPGDDLYVPPPDDFPGETRAERYKNWIENYLTWEPDE